MPRALARWLLTAAKEHGAGYAGSAMRYRPLLHWLGRRGLPRRDILEAGAHARGFGRFAKTDVVTVDRDGDRLLAAGASPFQHAVLVDPAHLPFCDGAFDVCVCVDTLARMASAEREQAIGELTRVMGSSGRAMVAFPAGELASQAEQRLRDAHRREGSDVPDWLEQHREHGLPEANAVFDYVHDVAGGRYRVTRSQCGSLRLWEQLGRLRRWTGPARALFELILRWGVPVLSLWRRSPCYRTAIWIEPKRR